MLEFTEELKREYFNALYNQQNGMDEPMKRFKLSYPELYRTVNAMYHKRKVMRENVYCMKDINNGLNGSLVFGALTYDNEHDSGSEANKRKQAVRYLNKCFDMYLFVEEHGSENERYHIHFVGILKPLFSYSDFLTGWHSRAQIEKVISIKRSINYLTDYVVKQVPRIRRNKKLIVSFNKWKKSNSWKNYGFGSLAVEEINDVVIDLVFGL